MTVKVPDTNTFSLQDVFNSVSSHAASTAGNLQSCFANAVNAYFDANYNKDSFAPANSMLRFRNYTPYALQNPTITISTITSRSVSGSCVWNAIPEFLIEVGQIWAKHANASITDIFESDEGRAYITQTPNTYRYRTGSFITAEQLIPNTTYYFRSYFITDSGVYYSPDQTVTTLP